MRVTVRLNDSVLADTTGALTLREANDAALQCIRHKDVDMTALAHSKIHASCPDEGEASDFTSRPGDFGRRRDLDL